MECQELAPVLSRVGFALQYRKDRLTSPLSVMPGEMVYRSRRRGATLQLSSKKFGCFKSVSWPLAKVRVTTESLVDTL